MSQRPKNNDSATYTPTDPADSPNQRAAPGHVNPETTRDQTIGGPTVGGEPAMPGTPQHEREVLHNKGKTPMGISTGLMWTVGIFSVIALILILVLTL